MITLQDWERRKAFVGFSKEDIALLREFHPTAERFAEEVVEALYGVMLRFDEVRAFFLDPSVLGRVKASQKKYFLELSEGEYGPEYLENRLRIGRIHNQIGLSPCWYMGTYSNYVRLITPIVCHTFGHDLQKAHSVLSALLKIMMLDQELALSTYMAAREETIAEQANEVAALYRKTEVRAYRMAALNELSKGITENLRLAEVIDRIARAGLSLLEAEHSSIFLLDDASGELHLQASVGLVPYPDPLPVVLRYEESIVGMAGGPVIVPDVQANPQWKLTGWAEREGMRSFIGCPFWEEGRVIGTMGCMSRRAGCYSGDDLALMEALAAHASIAIQNARLHQEARRSLEFFQSVVDDNVDAIVVGGLDSRILFWNRGAESLFGYLESEVLGRDVRELIHHGEDEGSVQRGEVIREGRALHFETVRRRKDGTQVPVSATLSPVKNGEGEVVAVSGVYKDLTKQKRAERERERYVARLERLQELTQKVSSSLDVEQVLPFIVQSAAALLNVPYAGLLLVRGDVLRVEAEHVEAINSQGMYEFPLQGSIGGHCVAAGEALYVEDVQKDPRWVAREWARREGLGSYLGLPLKYGGQVLGVMSCISRGQRLFGPRQVALMETFARAAALAIHNAETHEKLETTLQEVQRRQAMVVRMEKLSALGTLAAGAAHEVLNPANVIGLYAQRLLSESGEGSPERKAGEVIWRSVGRITSICDGLRRFSRNEPPRVEPFCPEETIEEAIRLVEHRLRLGSVEVDGKFRPMRTTLPGDRDQLTQVFVNLMRNAVDAMPGGGLLTIDANVVGEGDDCWWEGRFSDGGHGIPPDVLPKIFDPFFTTKPEEKGTGLGLAVVQGIVEGHGGRIWAESPPGQGATFVVRLPLRRSGV